MSKAMELILTRVMIDSKEAYRIGFVNQVFPTEKLMDGALELAGKIASNSPLALKLPKKAVRGAADMEEHQSMHYTHILIIELLDKQQEGSGNSYCNSTAEALGEPLAYA